MNILFVHHYECCPNLGGIERVTDKLATEFSSHDNVKCFSIFREAINEDIPRTKFEKQYHIEVPDANNYAKIIHENKIDIILNQEEHYSCKELSESVKISGRKCPIIYTFHSSPMMSAKALTKFNKLFFDFIKNPNFSSALKIISYPLYRQYNLNIMRKYYRESYLYSDKNVLLSDQFRKSWMHEAKISEDVESKLNKITNIPNPLSFNQFAEPKDIHEKLNRVLLVGRLSNPAKRIDLALKIWQFIEQDQRFENWYLDIVGDGPDKTKLEKYAHKHLSRVTFHGRQDPITFYKQSAIFMMTSDHEGWGLTLTEASQMGCVPIVFNSFSSLFNIIEDSVNGFIIKKNDTKAYVEKLKFIMLDRTTREKIATNAVRMSKRFTISEVYNKWNSLFAELLTDYTKK